MEQTGFGRSSLKRRLSRRIQKSMTNRIIVALLRLLPVMATGEAQSTLPLALGCSGTALNGHTNTNITDLSIIVDFDRHTVSGFFWVDPNGVPTPIPITTIDADSIDFHGIDKSDLVISSITGSIDRITGTVQASGTTLLQNGNKSVAFYNLQCKPTKPLF